MLSQSMSAFEENCGDVERLLDIHRELAGEGPGKKHGVEVLNKSAVVSMCAAWEAYCEDIVAEAIDHLVDHAADASNIRNLFQDAVGLPNVPSAWYWQKMSADQAADKLDNYVTLRGDIAHRSKAAASIKRSDASKFGEHVKRLVEKTDLYINQQLEKVCGTSMF